MRVGMGGMMKGNTDVIKIVIAVALLLVVMAVLYQIFSSQIGQGERTLDSQQEGGSRQICQQNCNMYQQMDDSAGENFCEVYPDCQEYVDGGLVDCSC